VKKEGRHMPVKDHMLSTKALCFLHNKHPWIDARLHINLQLDLDKNPSRCDFHQILELLKICNLI
jgi:hypothetical protein